MTDIDALSHAVEAYLAKNPNPVSDLIAERAIELAVCKPKLAYQDGHNLKASSHMMLARTMAVIAASNAGSGVLHALGRMVRFASHGDHRPLFSVGAAYNLMTAPQKCTRISQFWGTNISEMVTTAAAKTAVQAIQTFSRSLNITDNLQTSGIQKKDIEILAEICVLDGSTSHNPPPITAQDFLDIYERTYQAVA